MRLDKNELNATTNRLVIGWFILLLHRIWRFCTNIYAYFSEKRSVNSFYTKLYLYLVAFQACHISITIFTKRPTTYTVILVVLTLLMGRVSSPNFTVNVKFCYIKPKIWWLTLVSGSFSSLPYIHHNFHWETYCW